MKKKLPIIIIFLLLAINTILLYRYVSILNREPVSTELFIDYYEKSVNENGGYEILDDSFYTITKKYEFFDKIAKKYGLKVDTIKINNPKISNNKLKIGQMLKFPSIDGFYYKIKKGDYLIVVAKRYGVPVENITDYNDIEPKKIRLGMEIFIKGVNYKKWYEVEHPPKPKKEPKKTNINTSKKSNGNIDNNVTQDKQSSGKGGFSFPVRYNGVSSPFGSRFHPILKRYILHTGVDLVAKFIPLRASKSGVVTYAGYMNGYGKIIIIKHDNGYETRYAHLSVISTKVGERVNQGDLIGKTGNSGRVTGAHLHFEIRKNGVPKNPMNFLR